MIRCMAGDEVRRADDPWTLERVLLLLQGEALRVISDEASGRQVEVVIEGMSAFELLCKALDGGDQELVHDVIQLGQAISQIPDREAKHLLIIITRMGEDPYSAAEILRDLGLRATNRDAATVQHRGAVLVHQHERRRKNLLSRVRAHAGASDNPVCWRCLKNDVLRIGEDCGDGCPGLKDPGWDRGRKRKWDWSTPIAPEDLTPERRQAELDHLVKTQRAEGDWPGERNRRRREMLGQFTNKLPPGRPVWDTSQPTWSPFKR